MATSTTTRKLTKIDRFNDIEAMLTGTMAPNGSTVTELVQFIQHEVELLNKKNKTPSKPTEKQKENANYKDMIFNYLMGQVTGMTCTEIQKAIPALENFTNQKVAALVRQLVTDGRIKKEIIGRKAVFSAC